MNYQFLFSTVILFGININVHSQEEKPDFQYSIESEIGKKTGLIGLELSPVNIAYQGYYLSFGVGARGIVSDIENKYSAYVNYNYNYFNHSINGNKLNILVEDYNVKTTNSFGIGFGYNVKSMTKNEMNTVTLKKKGNTEFIAELPEKSVHRLEARIGFDHTFFLSRGETNYSDTIYDDWGNNPVLANLPGVFLINQNSNMISVGFGKKKSVESIYKTDKFGIVKHLFETHFYGDILIGFGGEFPALYEAHYADQTYPNEITSIERLTDNAQTGVQETFSKLPVGLRIGFTKGVRITHSVSWDIQLSLYPGYYKQIAELAQLKLGFSYRFTRLLK